MRISKHSIRPDRMRAAAPDSSHPAAICGASLCMVLAGWLLVTPSAAQESASTETVEARLQRLESRVDSLQDANHALRQELGVEGKSGMTVVKPAGREPVLQFGGLLQVQGDFGDQADVRFGTHDRFHLRRARLNATGRFLEEWDFRLEAELTGTVNEATGLRAQMTDGYVNWNRYLGANVRLGQFKTPFGYEQLYSDPRLYTIERSLMNDRLTLSRQIGAAFVGWLYERRLNYSVGLFNGTGVNASFNDNDNFTWVGRVEAVPHQGRWGGHEVRWGIGGNGYSTHDTNLAGAPPELGFDSTPGGNADNVFSGDRTGWGVDSQFRVGSLDIWAEYLQVRYEPGNAIPAVLTEADGAYVQAACFIVPRRLQAVAKWDHYDPRRHRELDATRTWTLGLNCTIKGDDLKLLVDGLAVDPEAPGDMQYKLLARAQANF